MRSRDGWSFLHDCYQQPAFLGIEMPLYCNVFPGNLRLLEPSNQDISAIQADRALPEVAQMYPPVTPTCHPPRHPAESAIAGRGQGQ